jgi:anti-anti-sigma factor
MSEDFLEIRLFGVPLAVQRQTAEHYDALLREFELIRQSDEASDTVPARLLTMIDELTARFEQFSEHPRTVFEAAQEQGGTTVDLVYSVPRDVVDACRRLLDLLDEADEYCLAGDHLVTLASPPVVRTYRDWFLGEFVEQAKGRAPRSWADAEPEIGQQQASAPHPPPAAQSAADSGSSDSNGDSDKWPTTIDGDTAKVKMAGELDMALAPSLRDHLHRLHSEGVRHYELDAAGVSFIDSVGLSVVLSLYRRCREEDGTLSLVKPSATIRRTLEISGLLEVLNVS